MARSGLFAGNLKLNSNATNNTPPFHTTFEDVIKSDQQFSPTFIKAVEAVQQEEFIDRFKFPISSDVWIEQAMALFTRHQIPIGYLDKLLKLQDNELCFVVDDSSSMILPSDNFPHLTRWQEEKWRLGFWMQFLSLLPIERIKITFLNACETVEISPRNANFPEIASDLLFEIFDRELLGPTPLKEKIAKEVLLNSPNTAFYILSDGMSYNCNPANLTNQLNKEGHPATLITLNDGKDVNQIDDEDSFFSYKKDKEAVTNIQGHAFPYTPGMWLLDQLIAVKNPDDLGKLKVEKLSKASVESILGYQKKQLDQTFEPKRYR